MRKCERYVSNTWRFQRCTAVGAARLYSGRRPPLGGRTRLVIIIKLKAKLQITSSWISEIMLYRIRRCKIHLSPSVIIDKKWSIQHRLKQMYDTNIQWVVSGILDSIVHKSKTTSRCLCLAVVITVIFPRMQFWMLNQMCSLFIIVAR